MDSERAESALYGLLDVSRSETRLLNICPGEFDDPITCSLAVVSLKAAPCYNALSYAWGNPEKTAALSINGLDIPVTENLVSIVRYLRASNGENEKQQNLQPTSIWIDAVCINQKNTAERTQQVLLMRDIYTQASIVLLWVGKPDQDSDWALDRINDPSFYHGLTEPQDSNASHNSHTQEQLQVMAILAKNVEKRCYWSRAWILQEVVLAREDPLLLCGSRQVLFSKYVTCSRLVMGMYGDPSVASSEAWDAARDAVPYHEDFVERIHSTDSLRHALLRDSYQTDDRQGLPLPQALRAASTMTATDRRDYVYSIAAIISKEDLEQLRVDYSKTAMEVYKDAWAVILHSPWFTSVDVFGNLIPALRSWTVPRPFPTWVPDLSGQSGRPSIEADSVSSGSPAWRGESSLKTYILRDILLLSGIVFDRVRDVGPEIEFNYGWDTREMDIQPLREAERLAAIGRKVTLPDLLEPFRELRSVEPVWETMCDWRWFERPQPSRLKDDSWLDGLHRTWPEMWEIFLGRQEMPAKWAEACPPWMKSNPALVRHVVLAPVLHSIRGRCHSNKTLLTAAGFFGVSTPNVEKGDAVVFVPGMRCVYFLRPFRDGYTMAGGFGYISGLMDFDRLDECIGESELREETLKIY